MCAHLQRHDIVAERAHRQRHDAEEDHDGAVHRAELVVELWGHDPARHSRLAQPLHQKPKRQRLAGIRQLPAHEHHQAEAKEEEHQGSQAVLNADHLVVGREDVLSPERQLAVMFVVMMRFCH